MSATTLRLGCRLLAPWLGLRPVLYLRSLAQRHPRRLPAACPPLGGCALCMAVGRCRRCRSSTMLSGVLSVLRCRALSYFGGGYHCALAGAHASGACVARGPNSPCSWSRGAPLPLLLLPRSLRSRPPRVWRASGERCPPTAGFFSAAALASFGRLPLSLIVRIASRSRALETPFCRGSVGVPSWRSTDYRHRKTGSALKAVRGFATLRYALFALAGYRALHYACVRPSPPFLLLARVLRVLGAGAPRPQPPF